MKITLLGPLSEGKPLFECELEVYEDDDSKALTGAVRDLRVLSLSRRLQKPGGNPWFERPVLVSMTGAPIGLKVGADRAGINGAAICSTIAVHKPANSDKPDKDWLSSLPTQATPIPILKIPDLLLNEGRIKLAIPHNSALGKFLQIHSEGNGRGSVFGSLPCKLNNQKRLEAIVTPAGIELDVEVPLPEPKSLPTPATVRLSWDPLRAQSYQLELVSEPENRIRNSFLSTFAQLRDPLEMEFNGSLSVPPVSWPLEVINLGGEFLNEALRLLNAEPTPGKWPIWVARLDGEAVRCRMRTKTAGAGEPRLAEIRSKLVRVTKQTETFGIDARTENSEDKFPEIGSWIGKDSKVTTPVGGYKVYIETALLRERLLPLYQEKGAVAANAEHPKYAFLFVDRGWLQCKLPDIKEGMEDVGMQKRQVLSGEVHIPMGDSRLLQLEGASEISMAAEWTLSTSALKIFVGAKSPKGKLHGFLFYAESSPSALDALPALDAGPIASRDVPLVFGDGWAKPKERLDGTLKKSPVVFVLDLTLAKDLTKEFNYLWLRNPTLPLIPNMPLTNGPAASGLPSPSRGLLPALTGKKVKLTFSGTLPLAESTLSWPPELKWPVQDSRSLALTSPTLPGAVYSLATPEVLLSAALRFDLPLLDELFATTTLSTKRQPPADPNEIPLVPTAVDPDLLAAKVWAPNIEKLRHAAVDAASMTGFSVVDQQNAENVVIDHLLEPYIWKTNWRPLAALRPPYGGYEIDGVPYDAEGAARGFKDYTFKVSTKELAPGNKIRVRNLAANLFQNDSGLLQDSRGFSIASGAVAGTGLTYRTATRYLKNEQGAVESKTFWLATANAPFTAGTAKLWFRDLPFPESSWEFDGTKNPLEQSSPLKWAPGFERDSLAESLFEWRLFQESDQLQNKPGNYYLQVDVFRFWPLRLESLKLKDGKVESLKVLGRADLKQPVAVDPSAPAFGPDRAFGPGNLVYWNVNASGASTLSAVDKVKNLRFSLNLNCKDQELQLGVRQIAVVLQYEITPKTWTLELFLAGNTLKMTRAANVHGLVFEAALPFLTLAADVNLDKGTITITPRLNIPTKQLGNVMALEWSASQLKWLLTPLTGGSIKWYLDLNIGCFTFEVLDAAATGEIVPGFSVTGSKANISLQMLVAPAADTVSYEVRALFAEASTASAMSFVHTMAVGEIENSEPGLHHDFRITGTIKRASQVEWPEKVYAVGDQEHPFQVIIEKRKRITWYHSFEVQFVDHEYSLANLSKQDQQILLSPEWRFEAVVKHTLKRSDGSRTLTWQSLDQLRMLSGHDWLAESEQLRKKVESFIPLRSSTYKYRDEVIQDKMPTSGRIAANLASSGLRDEGFLSRLPQLIQPEEVFLMGAGLTLFRPNDEPSTLRWPLLWPYFAGTKPSEELTFRQRDPDGPLSWRVAGPKAVTHVSAMERDGQAVVLPLAATEDEIGALLYKGGTSIIPPEWVQQLFFEPLGRTNDRDGGLYQSAPFFLATLLMLEEMRTQKQFPIPDFSLRLSVKADGVCHRVRLPEPGTREATASPCELIVLSRVEGVCHREISNADAKSAVASRIASLAREIAVEPLAAFLRRDQKLLAFSLGGPPDLRVAPGGTVPPGAVVIPPSPALGWPSTEKLDVAVKMRPLRGADEVCVDENEGMAGRTSATGWPAAGLDPKQAEAVYYNSFAGVMFQSNAPAIALQAPAPRHFSPLPPRVRAPRKAVIEAALSQLTASQKPEAWPITAPDLEIASFGHRPGAFHVYTTSVTVPGRDARLGADDAKDAIGPNARFGRPATRGPALAHQLRAPRGTKLPGLEPFALRRRTFLSEADPDLLFGEFPGLATVWRYDDRKAETLVGDVWQLALSADTSDDNRNRLSTAWLGNLVLKIAAKSRKYPKPADGPWQPATGLDARLTDFKRAKAILHIGAKQFPMVITVSVPNDTEAEVKLTIDGSSLRPSQDALAAVTANTSIYLEFHFPGPVKDAQTPANDDPLPAKQDHISLPLQVAAPDRPVLNLVPTTLVFGDPSYDRQLSSPACLVPRTIDNTAYALSLDRRQYESTATVYLAFGKLGVGKFEDEPDRRTLRLDRLPAAGGSEPLTLNGAEKFENLGAKVYSVSLPDLRKKTGEALIEWSSGDLLQVSLQINADPKSVILATVRITDEPQIAAAAAVFSVIRVPTGGKSSNVALHASAPMPQRIEFPDLLSDLALGHVRRKALFIWRWSEMKHERTLALVKVDRAGGTQIPQPK